MPTQPSPLSTQPNHPPQAGQFTSYTEEDGTMYNAVIMSVKDTSPDGQFVQVGVEWYDASTNPVSVQRNGRLYNVKLGRVFYCPCAPPFPAKCP